MARECNGDPWQDFTGAKVTVIDNMLQHIKQKLKGFPYQFGIFLWELRHSIKKKKKVGHWVLQKMYDLEKSNKPLTIGKGDRLKKKPQIPLVVVENKPTKSYNRLQSIRRVQRKDKVANVIKSKASSALSKIQLIQAQPSLKI